jgi:glycerate kinase
LNCRANPDQSVCAAHTLITVDRSLFTVNHIPDIRYQFETIFRYFVQDFRCNELMNRAPMRILVAPDSFKGSLDAPEFCAIAEQVFTACLPGSEVVGLPMADGGEGTAEALVRGTAGEMHPLRVTGPLGETVEASYGLLGDGITAVVEMARASGLPLVPADRLDPLRATSRGTGELIAAALEQGVEHIILALGGSATNDGGMGALQALGFAFLDRTGSPVKPTGEGLEEIVSVVAERVHPRLGGVSITIASDVTNPLLGERGATATYGPQKGADTQTSARLERGLTRFAEVTAEFTGSDHRGTSGAGAAGGMGFGFLSYTGGLPEHPGQAGGAHRRAGQQTSDPGGGVGRGGAGGDRRALPPRGDQRLQHRAGSHAAGAGHATGATAAAAAPDRLVQPVAGSRIAGLRLAPSALQPRSGS